MRGIKTLFTTAVLLAGLAMAPAARAQIVVGFGIQPVCSYGYYGYAPYQCAPMGYYGPGYFYNGIFLGMGPWGGWGYSHGWGGHRFTGEGGGSFHGGPGSMAYAHGGGAFPSERAAHSSSMRGAGNHARPAAQARPARQADNAHPAQNARTARSSGRPSGGAAHGGAAHGGGGHPGGGHSGEGHK